VASGSASRATGRRGVPAVLPARRRLHSRPAAGPVRRDGPGRLAAAGVPPHRRPGPQLALACLLFTGTAVVVPLAPDVYQSSWRYELPVVITLIPAGVLGITALLSLRGAGRGGGGPDAGAREAPAGPLAARV